MGGLFQMPYVFSRGIAMACSVRLARELLPIFVTERRVPAIGGSL